MFLDFLATVTSLRQLNNSLKITRALFELSETEWERSRDIEMDEHLIKNVFTNSKKTDAIQVYTSKLVKIYMMSVGPQPGIWTRQTLASENSLTKAVFDRICVTKITSNKELFTLVASRLLGIDNFLIEASICDKEDHLTKAKCFINYLGWTDNNTDSPEDVYRDTVFLLAELSERDLVNDVFFNRLVTEGNLFFNPADSEQAPDYNAMDALDIFDTVIHQTAQGYAEYHEAHTVSIAVSDAFIKNAY